MARHAGARTRLPKPKGLPRKWADTWNAVQRKKEANERWPVVELRVLENLMLELAACRASKRVKGEKGMRSPSAEKRTGGLLRKD